jgi:dihydroxyacetone kinase phosphotransfer subunit
MIGILVVSHSESAARGIAEIARGMSGTAGNIPSIVAVGGNDEGGLGVSVLKVLDALNEMLPRCEGILIVPDLGSSVLASRGAIEMLEPQDAARVTIADAPVLEGAMMAAIEASVDSNLADVAEAAKDAKNLEKGEH